MTESQIKQFAVQSEELKRRCDELSKLNASIAQTISSYDKTGQFKLPIKNLPKEMRYCNE